VRRSSDRKAVDGTKLAQGRSLYDFTISAPKSVSILAVVAGDDRLIEAHRTAVSETLKEAEPYAASRVRQARANEDRPTGNLALVVYHHDTSRELDPQLHTHAIAANLTYDGTEGRWKALQASEIYQRRAYLSEVYRNALAREVRALGYEVESQRDSKGHDAGFEIRGVPRSYSRSSASAAFSGIRRSRSSWRSTGEVRGTTRSQCWFGNPGRTSSSRSRRTNCVRNSTRGSQLPTRRS
jgi:conjugative relaxase-like TrwC/TraI family protein